ncbi:hypothetical protein, partial [Exiguobacterium sp. KRL4]|uniref:hypothetical protein n=1 Tax=Exiguobacterium sp. KRL4 TaxID=1914536 RepID=UPI001F23F68B
SDAARCGAMLVPGKRFEANKKAILLDKEKNRYFVFSLKGDQTGLLLQVIIFSVISLNHSLNASLG